MRGGRVAVCSWGMEMGASFGGVARATVLAAMLAFLSACGGGGGGSTSTDDPTTPTTPTDPETVSDDPWLQRTAASDQLANECAEPRSGTDPYNDNEPYPDLQGTLDDERNWLMTYMDEVYLWYGEIPTVSDSSYTSARYGSNYAALDALFDALLTPETTASGAAKDRFSFTYPTDEINALLSSGSSVGYGAQLMLVVSSLPRDMRIAYVDPGSPADAAGLGRGDRITAIDGVDLEYSNTTAAINTLNAGLSPDTDGETHVWTVWHPASGASEDVILTATTVTPTPVLETKVLSTSTGNVGYVLFNDHIATAEGELYDAFTTLAAAGVSDLVLDLRYNGGGYLDIASELAFMIAGPGPTDGKSFETLSFNDKNPLSTLDTTTGFHDTSLGFDSSFAAGQALPTLNLSRVFILTTDATCSASEAVINGLRGVDVEVNVVGSTTCGKPYGFFQQDNCGTSYFAIEFQGVNAKGDGGYSDGIDADCPADDDLLHALGDTDESSLAAALALRDSGSCPASAGKALLSGSKPTLLRSVARENAYRTRPGSY